MIFRRQSAGRVSIPGGVLIESEFIQCVYKIQNQFLQGESEVHIQSELQRRASGMDIPSKLVRYLY